MCVWREAVCECTRFGGIFAIAFIYQPGVGLFKFDRRLIMSDVTYILMGVGEFLPNFFIRSGFE